MTDKEQIIIDGEIYNPCNGCELWDRDYCTGDKSYQPNGKEHKIICDRHISQQFWKIRNALARKTQECESYRKALEEIEKICEEGLYAGINYEILNIISKADFGKSERSETCPSESCVEPVEPPIIQEAKGEGND